MRPDGDYYVLPDPELEEYDRGVGTLRLDGVVVGHLASVVGRMTSGSPWPWFVVVWEDGRKELSFEDYGPAWPTVRELDAGFLELHGPGTTKERKIFGRRVMSSKRGRWKRFEFEWLPRQHAAKKWIELGLEDTDF